MITQDIQSRFPEVKYVEVIDATGDIKPFLILTVEEGYDPQRFPLTFKGYDLGFQIIPRKSSE